MNWVKTFIFTLIAPGAVWVYLPWLILRGNPGALPARFGLLQIIGVLLALIGFSIYAWTSSDFIRIGKGTPAPVFPTRMLVVKGLYKYVRNPMYLGVLTGLAGEVCFFQSPRLMLYTGIVWFVVHLFVILYEEPTLQKSFDGSYTEYRQRVRRWLPRRSPYRPDQPGG